MGRLFIIGAGFSKAIAKNAPLAKNMLKTIWENPEIYNNTSESKYEVHKKAFISTLEFLHQSVQKRIINLEKIALAGELDTDFEKFLDDLDVEFFCSYLDLLSTHLFRPKSKNKPVDLQGCSFSYLKELTHFQLKKALNFIDHSIVNLLLPSKLNVNSDIFDKLASFFKNEDAFISFNYDVLLEQMLYQKGLWNPFDGYEIEFKNKRDCQNSQTKVIKLHGSINWIPEDLPCFSELPQLRFNDPTNQKPFFSKLEGRDIPSKKIYPISAHIVAPTFMKNIQYGWEFNLLKKMITQCQEATEIYLLGYRAPESDYIANLIFSTISKTAKIKIVLWENRSFPASILKKQFEKKYNLEPKNITPVNKKIEEWIENPC